MARDTYETSDAAENVVPKDGLGNGLVILTTLALLIAIVLVNMSMKKHFDTGMFGDSKIPNPEAAAANAKKP